MITTIIKKNVIVIVLYFSYLSLQLLLTFFLVGKNTFSKHDITFILIALLTTISNRKKGTYSNFGLHNEQHCPSNSQVPSLCHSISCMNSGNQTPDKQNAFKYLEIYSTETTNKTEQEVKQSSIILVVVIITGLPF